MSDGSNPATPQPPRKPRLIIPGAPPPAEPDAPPPPAEPVAPAPPPAEPQPLQPQAQRPQALQPQPLQPQQLQPQPLQPQPLQPPMPEQMPMPEPVAPEPLQPPPLAAVPWPSQPVAPQPLQPAPPPVVVQAVATEPVPVQAAPPPAAQAVPSAPLQASGAPAPSPQGWRPPAPAAGPRLGLKMVKPGKKTGKGPQIALAVTGLIVLLVAVVMFLQHSSGKKEAAEFAKLLESAANPGTTELTVSAGQLDRLLLAAARSGPGPERQKTYRALLLARVAGSDDADARIVQFITATLMPPETREQLLRDVVQKRANPAVIGTLLEYAGSTDDPRTATAALQACRAMAGPEQLALLLEVIQGQPEVTVLKAAEEMIDSIIGRATDRKAIEATLIERFDATSSDAERQSLIRLLCRTGGEQAAGRIEKILSSGNPEEIKAAVSALNHWPDFSMFERMMRAARRSNDNALKQSAFRSGFRMLAESSAKPEPEQVERLWKSLASVAESDADTMNLVRRLAASESTSWAVFIIEYFRKKSSSDDVVEAAERALLQMRENSKLK